MMMLFSKVRLLEKQPISIIECKHEEWAATVSSSNFKIAIKVLFSYWGEVVAYLNVVYLPCAPKTEDLKHGFKREFYEEKEIETQDLFEKVNCFC